MGNGFRSSSVSSKRRRGGLFLATLLAVLIVLLNIATGGKVSALVRDAVAPIENVGMKLGMGIGRSGFFSSRTSLESQIAALQGEVQQNQLQAAAYTALQQQNQSLSSLEHLAQTSPGLAAPVTSSIISSPYGTFTIGAGSADSVTSGALVLTEGGFVVGKVSQVQERQIHRNGNVRLGRTNIGNARRSGRHSIGTRRASGRGSSTRRDRCPGRPGRRTGTRRETYRSRRTYRYGPSQRTAGRVYRAPGTALVSRVRLRHTMMLFRVAVALIGFLSALFLPWYVPAICIFVLSIRFRAWEAIALGVFMDLLWLAPGSGFHELPLFTAFAILVVWAFEPLRVEFLS